MSEHDFDTVLAKLIELRASALVISGDELFSSRSTQLAALTANHAVPAAYQHRDFAAAGGLMSYGSSITDTHRLAGMYAGRILKGDKPAGTGGPLGPTSPPGMPQARRQLAQREYQSCGCGRRKTARDEHGHRLEKLQFRRSLPREVLGCREPLRLEAAHLAR